MNKPQVVRELKRDLFGRIELLEGPSGRAIRRVAGGGRNPLVGSLARLLLRRERRALRHLEGLPGVARVVTSAEYPDYGRAPSIDRSIPRSKEVLLRTFLEGVPLYAALELPRDFFERLEDLVYELHRRGVCHNDLHKEPNVLIAPQGRPLLVDFQLASVHRSRGRVFRVRAAEDLRHVQKHKLFYERALGTAGTPPLSKGRPSAGAALWMGIGKPLYNVFTRGVLGLSPGEERRPPEGPWPRWSEPIGPPRD